MFWLVILFALLAIVFGFWGFGAGAATAWVGAPMLFWICVVLLILALIGWGGGYWYRRPLP
jgi:uncharacterized membrane protein YtjA (UPF0391 family)